jgi:membrane associated rhomboid family serine protease
MLPPLLVDQISSRTHRSFLLRSRISIEIILLAASVSMFAARSARAADGKQCALVFLGLAAFLLFDYWMVYRQLTALAERSLFALWVRDRTKKDLALWSALMLGAGTIQTLAQYTLGGLAPLVEKYGASFQALEHGEYWRLVTGPFIHLNFAHWATNSALLLIFAMVAGTISRVNGVAVFLAGSALGALTTWATSSEVFSCYVGVSAGVMAILGFCAGAALRHPGLFPIRFGWSLTAFGLMNLFLPWAYSADAANAAHGAGLGFGIVWGLIHVQRRNQAAPTALTSASAAP